MNELKNFLTAVKGVLDEVYLPPDTYIGLLNDNLEPDETSLKIYYDTSDVSGRNFYTDFLIKDVDPLMPYLLRIYLRHPLLRENEPRYFFDITPTIFNIIGPKIAEHIKNDNHKEKFYKNIDEVSKDFGDDPLKQNFKRFLYYFYNYIIKDFDPKNSTTIPGPARAAPRKRHLGGTRKKHLMKVPKRIKGFTIKKK